MTENRLKSPSPVLWLHSSLRRGWGATDTKLREKKFCILIHLQRKKHIYLYSSIRAKKEIKLESN